MQQMSPTAPINWTNETDHDPYTIIGDTSWTNYTVQADVLLEQPGSAEVLGRVNQQSKNNKGLNSYRASISDTGAWSIVKTDTTQTTTTLASGTTTAPGTNTWHTLALKMQGSTLTALLDGSALGSATDATFTSGMAGLGVVGYQTDQFANFTLTPGPATQQVGPITSGLPGKCVDDNGDSNIDGTKVQLWDCNGGASQNWTWSNGTLTNNGKCMDVTGQRRTNGTLIEIWTCNGGTNQQWVPQSNGELVSVQSGLCLDDPAFNTTNGTQLEIWTCNGGANQKWTLP
jgi:hypothetical protein